MWEYKVIQTSATGVPLGKGNTYTEQLESGLNALGKDGWELCCVEQIYFFFKRPKVPKTPHVRSKVQRSDVL